MAAAPVPAIIAKQAAISKLEKRKKLTASRLL